MNHGFYISNSEREYLRELARKQLEYSNLPIMEERKRLWYAHNSLKGERPLIIVEMLSFEGEMQPAYVCESPAARKIEREINRWIVNHEKIDDDKVIPDFYTVYWNIGIDEFGVDIPTKHALDGSGRNIGHTWEHPIKDLARDFTKLKPSKFWVDRKSTLAWKEFVQSIIGDILPVRIKNNSLQWRVTLSEKVVRLMGLENMMYALFDYPDEIHELFKFLVHDIMAFVKWQQQEGLLTLNNGNDYTGAGSYGFTTELPTKEHSRRGIVTPSDLWLNMNSQESVGISSEMYGEFIFPYYYLIAKEFGLVYYGCCEPVHDIWNDYISKLPNLRKVSVSPWCNEGFMGEVLQGGNVIYSRKPSPNYLGVGDLDEDAFREHITKTLQAAKRCSLEIIFRDVYTVNNDLYKPGRAVKIVRKLIEEIW